MEQVIKPAFKIMGISVKTSNRDIAKLQQDLGGLWQRFFSENIMQQIPAPLSQDIYCVYTNYDGDYLDPYETIIGLVVSVETIAPAGLVEKIVPEQKYNLYRAIGKMPDAVGAMWHHIWQSPLERNYIADFDVYGSKSQNPESGEVDIFVGIK